MRSATSRCSSPSKTPTEGSTDLSEIVQGQIGATTVTFLQADITELEVDAIVNSANSGLKMGAGVALAIRRRGGEEIEHEAVGQGPIDVGGCVVTSGGRLKARHVIHAAVMGPNLQTDVEKITSALQTALQTADRERYARIAFPAMGTGVGGFLLEDCARTMLGVVQDYLSQGTSGLKEIIFALYGDEGFRVFCRTLVSLSAPVA